MYIEWDGCELGMVVNLGAIHSAASNILSNILNMQLETQPALQTEMLELKATVDLGNLQRGSTGHMDCAVCQL